VSQAEARECFKRGYLEAGGKPEELSHYWQAGTKLLAQPCKLRYDDKDVPDEDEIPA